MRKEIKIAGCGLSGLVAGINLLSAGHKVTIYEQGADAGLRFSNDFQGIANWLAGVDIKELLREMNISEDFFISPLDRGIFFGPGIKGETKFVTSKPIIYLVKRGVDCDCLDFSLKRQFLESGGEIKFNAKSDLINVDIVATGPKKSNFRTLGYNFETVLEDSVFEIMDNDIAPKAYAYLLVRGGRGTLGAVLTEQFGKHKDFLNKTVDIFKNELGLVMENEEKFSGFANFFLAKTAVKEGKLYVGEAAGFLDSLTGFGMFYAMRSGYLAAKTIAQSLDYDKLWKDEFSNPIKSSMVGRFAIEVAGNFGYRAMPGWIEKNQVNLLDSIRKSYNLNKAKKLIFPVADLFLRKRV